MSRSKQRGTRAPSSGVRAAAKGRKQPGAQVEPERALGAPSLPPLDAEWLETDGLGGFASGTVSGIRTRRYHALLLVATTPPTGRMVLVNGLEAWVATPTGTYALTSQRYTPDVVHPEGWRRVESFAADPWPTWVFRLEDGTRIEHQLLSVHGSPGVILTWALADDPSGEVTVSVRPLLSGRDSHALHHENPAFRFDGSRAGESIRWRPYDGVPSILAASNGSFEPAPVWYRNFLYTEERARGLDHVEDLASPGIFSFDLSRGEAWLTFTTDGGVQAEQTAPAPRASGSPGFLAHEGESPERALGALLEGERTRRRGFRGKLHRAADAYLVRRGTGKTIVAGYPWFTDWGRDTFIALRGLCLATGRIDDARQILLEWAGAVSEGMLPNRFPEAGDQPEYNSVDASLWYVVAVHDFLEAVARARRRVSAAHLKELRNAILAIVSGYASGTRYHIRMDEGGLLRAGEPGIQLTWMDAKVGDWVVTPRIGKPVEVQALWLNALRIVCELDPRWMEAYERGLGSFERRFWIEAKGYLYDVVDVDHVSGTADTSLRPNQIFAVGGLPHPLLGGIRARQVVDAVEAHLITPAGLRTLAPSEPGYVGRYEGGVRERDGSYHQGTAWPWLIGPFVDAWIRVRGDSPDAKGEARDRFVNPLLAHLDPSGLGHISEIADAEPPHTPRGCPFQAWSLGELIRALRRTETDRAVP
jgi:glycogen debranching enzyme